MKRRLLGILLTTVMLFAICSPAMALGEIDLVFWVYSDFTMGKSAEVFEQWVKDFTENDPDVRSIQFVAKNDSELLTGLMAGVGLPDCFSASARDAKKYYEAIDLLNLKEIFDDEAYASGFYPLAREAFAFNDGVWALPFISYIPLLLRNLDVLESAGVDTTVPYNTMDELYAMMDAVKAKGIGVTHSWAAGGYYCPGAIMALDADVLTPGIENSETTLKPEQLVRTFETINKLETYSNSMVYNDDVTMEAFQQNNLAFILVGPWNLPSYDASGVRYDITLIPPYEENGRTGGLQGWDLMYGVKSGDEKKDAAVRRWLKYMGEVEQQAQWASEIGRPVLRQDAMNLPEVQENSMLKISAEGLNGGMRQMDFGRSNVFWPSAIRDVALKAASGEYSAQEAADEFINAINDMIIDSGE